MFMAMYMVAIASGLIAQANCLKRSHVGLLQLLIRSKTQPHLLQFAADSVKFEPLRQAIPVPFA